LANHKSAEKRARQTIKRNARNSQAKASVKTTEKNLAQAIETKSADLPTVLKAYVKRAMSAASKGTLRKETVSRRISRLSKRAHQALNAAK
jgi:small subunit ribosomal protein S20